MNRISTEIPLEDHSVPYYYQIENLLRRKIERGELAPGEKLPRELDLAKIFGVSRVTLRQALSILEADGLVDRRRGHGTFVTKTFRNPEQIKLTGIIEQSYSYSETRLLLSVEDVSPSPQIEEFFGLSKQDHITRIRRIRMGENTPYCYITHYLPVNLAKKVRPSDILHRSMLDIIKKRIHLPPVKIHQTLEARTADNEVAGYLSIKMLDPVLYVETFVYGHEGEPIEHSQTYYRGNQHKYSIELLSNGDII
ncbi:GntR family transcriptional regulator [Nitrospinota bacterium]